MGKIKQGILGGFSDKVGTVIGSFWKGKSYMRGLNQSYHDAKTQDQLAQRAKFGLMNRFVSKLSTIVEIGFKDSEHGTTANNEAVRYNLLHAITGTYPSFAVDYANVLVSMGPLPNVEAPAANDDGAGHLEVSWTDNTGDGDTTGDDPVMVLIYNSDKDATHAFPAAAKRGDQTFTFTNPTNWSADTVHVYVAAKSVKDSTTSRSEYLGTVILS